MYCPALQVLKVVHSDYMHITYLGVASALILTGTLLPCLSNRSSCILGRRGDFFGLLKIFGRVESKVM